MTLHPLPELLGRGVGLLTFAIAIGLVAAHAAMAAMAARRSRSGRLQPAAFIGAYLTVWLALGITVGSHMTSPATPGLAIPWPLLIAGLGPALAGIAILFASRTVRELNDATPPHWLVWAQTYRVAGLMFLFPYLYYGVIPAGFAIPAAVGDFVTGALAPVVALGLAERRPYARRWAVAWNLLGILDLIVAPAAAVLTQAPVLYVYPLSLVPLFAGPPLGILAHVYSLRNLAAQSSSTVSDPARHSIRAEQHATTIA
jgi:hypothetical protein